MFALNRRIGLALACALTLAPAAASAVTAGSFTATATDDYESYAGGRASITSLFGGTVGVSTGSVEHRSVDQGDWNDFRSSSPIVPASGTKFGTLFGFGYIDLDFTALGGIFGFGGMASAAGSGSDVISFYDMSDALLFTFTDSDGFGPGNGTMEAFSFVSDVAIGRIRLTGPETAYDDLSISTVSTVPLPASIVLLVGSLAGMGLVGRRRSNA